MAGTPLLGDQLLLETYSYLDDSAVHLLQPGEIDAAAMARLLALPAFEVQRPSTLSLMHLQCCKRAMYAN